MSKQDQRQEQLRQLSDRVRQLDTMHARIFNLAGDEFGTIPIISPYRIEGICNALNPGQRYFFVVSAEFNFEPALDAKPAPVHAPALHAEDLAAGAHVAVEHLEFKDGIYEFSFDISVSGERASFTLFRGIPTQVSIHSEYYYLVRFSRPTIH